MNDGLHSISSEAFSGCINIISLKVPKSVFEIGQYAFRHCNDDKISLPMKFKLKKKSIFGVYKMIFVTTPYP